MRGSLFLDPIALGLYAAIATTILYTQHAMNALSVFPTILAIALILAAAFGVGVLLACSLERIDGVNEPGYIPTDVVRKAASTSPDPEPEKQA